MTAKEGGRQGRRERSEGERCREGRRGQKEGDR